MGELFRKLSEAGNAARKAAAEQASLVEKARQDALSIREARLRLWDPIVQALGIPESLHDFGRYLKESGMEKKFKPIVFRERVLYEPGPSASRHGPSPDFPELASSPPPNPSTFDKNGYMLRDARNRSQITPIFVGVQNGLLVVDDILASGPKVEALPAPIDVNNTEAILRSRTFIQNGLIQIAQKHFA